jgi:hypothetical protein
MTGLHVFWWPALAIAIWWALSGCATVSVGPFVPSHPHPCGGDSDCPPTRPACRFPAVDTHAVCFPAQGDPILDTPEPK